MENQGECVASGSTAFVCAWVRDFIEGQTEVGPNSEKTMPQALLRFGDCLPVSVDD
jgi:hypothetical protein